MVKDKEDFSTKAKELSKVRTKKEVKSLAKRRFGISKVVFEIEGLILKSKYLENKLYKGYLSVSKSSKVKFREELGKIVREYLVNKEFMLAIAQDVIERSISEEGKEYYSYNIESKVFEYLKRNLYKGNSRELLRELMKYIKES